MVYPGKCKTWTPDSWTGLWTGLWTEILTEFWTDRQFNDDCFQLLIIQLPSVSEVVSNGRCVDLICRLIVKNIILLTT